jgi:hypothetical protein
MEKTIMKRIVIIVILLLAVLVPSSAAVAFSPHDRIIRDGQTENQSITLIDDKLVVEEGGTVNGDVTLFDSTADIAGEINGDVSVFDGDVVLTGRVSGDLVLFAGSIDVQEGAEIDGSCFVFGGEVTDTNESISCGRVDSRFDPSGVLGSISPPAFPERPEEPFVPDPPEFDAPPPPVPSPVERAVNRVGYIFLSISEVVGRSLLLGVLALLISAIFPRQVHHVSDALRRKPAASGVVGLLTAIAGPSLIVLLLVVLAITCVGLLLYPAVFMLGLALAAAALLGWIALGDVLGRIVANSLRMRTTSGSLITALGTMLLTLILGGLGLLPFIWGESVLLALLACVGLGAAALTQLGTRPYPPDSPPEDAPPAHKMYEPAKGS